MIRKAKISDVKEIHKLINYYAQKGKMLPRSLNELYENLRDFFVKIEKNKVIGCAAIHIAWENLGEIKSVAVASHYKGKSIGTSLLESCLKEAQELEIKKVFTLTYVPIFFERFGFKRIKREKLPHKIWAECIHCPKFPNCDEIALIKNITKQKSKSFR